MTYTRAELARMAHDAARWLRERAEERPQDLMWKRGRA